MIMKLKASIETETFISEAGYYTLKQENFLDEDQIISLTPAQMAHIIIDMQSWLADKSWYEDVVIEVGREDLSK
jgi:hypothetical protein